LSSAYYHKKSLPLSLALGITHTLNDNDASIIDFLSPLSLENQKTLMLNTGHLAAVCYNPHPKDRKPNLVLISLAVRRVLAMKSKSKFPVIIAVKNYEEGRAFAEVLAQFASGCKMYNMLYSIKNKLPKWFLTSFHTEADFILLTYHKLREIVLKKACPTTEQIVFINPLTKHRCSQEAIFLDDIIGVLHRHKCRKPHFSFLFDSASFPLLTHAEYKHLLGVENCLFFQCEEPKRIYFDNQLQERLPFLVDEHIQFFLLRELFRGRKSLKKLLARFKTTIAYKLLLYSNNLYPALILPTNHPLTTELLERKAFFEKSVQLHITRMLHLFCKGVSKTISGEKCFQDIFSENNSILWNEPVDTAPFLPLVEKKQDRNYYLTSLGQAVFVSSSNYEGVQKRFSSLLNDLSETLFKNKISTTKFSLQEIIDFYSLLIGNNPVEFPDKLKKYLSADSKNAVMELYPLLDQFIEEQFSYKINRYEGLASLQLLSPFEELMDVRAQMFLQQLKTYRKENKQSWKEKRREIMLAVAQTSILSVKKFSQKYGLDYQQVKKELEGLVAEGLLVSFRTIDNLRRPRIKYCTPELLEKCPHLKKTCGTCRFYNKRFKTCSFLRLVEVNNPSSFPTDYLDYTHAPINTDATACEFHEDQANYCVSGNKLKFALSIEELTQQMRRLPTEFLLGQTEQIAYHCISCQQVMEEFGSGEELFFPRRRISCPNCATVYLRISEHKVAIQIEQRHLLRIKYYELVGSVPTILEEKDPSYAFVIYDTERVELEQEDDGSYVLVICNHKVPLAKVQYLFFAGKRYKALEDFLFNLAQLEPDKYHYAIKRTQAKEDTKQDQKVMEDQPSPQPFSSDQYTFLQDLISFLNEQQLFNTPISTTRNLSNIAGILYLQKISAEQDKPLERINRQLYEMIDLQLRVRNDVQTSDYGRQLEALSNNFFFELIKEEGAKTGLWSYGRVNSRLVKDKFLSFTNKTSNAYAPFDALLNQLVRIFRSRIDLLFLKVGLEPDKLGSGLFHRRKTKSDIDQLGLYFDLIEPLRVLVLVTLYEAIQEGTLNATDCSYVLGSNNQEIYRVQIAAQEKIKQLVDEALTKQVFFDGRLLPFEYAFEQYLLTFKQAILNCYEQSQAGRHLSSQRINQLFQTANFSLFTFCPANCVKELLLVNNFAAKFAAFYRGSEERVFAEKRLRFISREYAMQQWRTSIESEGSQKVWLSHHQQKEQERSLLVALVFLYYGLQNEFIFAHHAIKDIRAVLGLSQNQAQRILTQMNNRGLLVKVKERKGCYYQLNLENQAVKELLFTLGPIITDDSAQQQAFQNNTKHLLAKIANLFAHLREIRDKHQFKSRFHTLWQDWSPPVQFQLILDGLREHLKFCKKYFERTEELGW